jgi:Type II secretory pathway, pullulanase PulA and related glycosidases
MVRSLHAAGIEVILDVGL